MSAQSPLRQGLHYFPMTISLVAICVGVFVLQLVNGVNITNPSSQELLRWGANFLPYSLDSQPWRIISSLFLHIGLLHLMFNMFALYYFGQVAERMFGSVNFLLLFILSGIGGNILNNYLGWQSVLHGGMPMISAGASGGIMGIGMALLVVALTKTAFNHIQLNFRSLLIVMAINLGYGFLVGGIDNAAHVGGSIIGVILAIAYLIQYKFSSHQRLLAQPTDTSTFSSIEPLPSNVQPIQLNKGPVVIATYIALLLMFAFVYWHLHVAYIEMITSSTTKLLY